MSRASKQNDLEKLKSSIADLSAQLASLAHQVEEYAGSGTPPSPSVPASDPHILFTKDGVILPGGPINAPKGANDIKFTHDREKITGGWWTKNNQSIGAISIPDGANDVHFMLGEASEGRPLSVGSSGDDVMSLQEDLLYLGHESTPQTGTYDEATERIVCDLQESLGLNPTGIVDAETLAAIKNLVSETIAAEMTPLAFEDVLPLNLVMADTLTEDRPPEGPKHKAWRMRLQKAFGKRLRQEGFTKNEINKILKSMLKGLIGILENLDRLRRVLRAYRKAKADVGPPPAWES